MYGPHEVLQAYLSRLRQEMQPKRPIEMPSKHAVDVLKVRRPDAQRCVAVIRDLQRCYREESSGCPTDYPKHLLRRCALVGQKLAMQLSKDRRFLSVIQQQIGVMLDEPPDEPSLSLELARELGTLEFSLQRRADSSRWLKIDMGHRSRCHLRQSPLRSFMEAARKAGKLWQTEVKPTLEAARSPLSLFETHLHSGPQQTEAESVQDGGDTCKRFTKNLRNQRSRGKDPLSRSKWNRMFQHVKQTAQGWQSHWHLYSLVELGDDAGTHEELSGLSEVWGRAGGLSANVNYRVEIGASSSTTSDDDRKHVRDVLLYGANWQKDVPNPGRFLVLAEALRSVRMTKRIGKWDRVSPCSEPQSRRLSKIGVRLSLIPSTAR